MYVHTHVCNIKYVINCKLYNILVLAPGMHAGIIFYLYKIKSPVTVYSLPCLHPLTVYTLHCLLLPLSIIFTAYPFAVYPRHCRHPLLSNFSLLPLSILYTVYPFTVYPLHCHKCSLQMITSLNKIIETITS